MVKCFVDYGERTRSVIELGKQTLNKASVRCAYAYTCKHIYIHTYSGKSAAGLRLRLGLRLRRDDRLKLNEISFRWSLAAANHLLVWMLDCWSATWWREGARYSPTPPPPPPPPSPPSPISTPTPIPSPRFTSYLHSKLFLFDCLRLLWISGMKTLERHRQLSSSSSVHSWFTFHNLIYLHTFTTHMGIYVCT